jgi:hypothetical protein
LIEWLDSFTATPNPSHGVPAGSVEVLKNRLDCHLLNFESKLMAGLINLLSIFSAVLMQSETSSTRNQNQRLIGRNQLVSHMTESNGEGLFDLLSLCLAVL